VAFAFAIAANVIAAIASLLTGRRKRAMAAAEALGAELAAVAAEGGTEPGELVVPGAAPEGAQGGGESGTNGQSAGIARPEAR
jgi:hypothetical protein